MKPLPPSVTRAWDNREPYVVLTTVSKEGVPNSVYVGSVGRYDERTFYLCNHHFKKTRQNILDDGRGSLLFLTREQKSYQLKGTFELQDSGPVYEAMQNESPAPYPASVAVLHVTEVYAGSIKLA